MQSLTKTELNWIITMIQKCIHDIPEEQVEHPIMKLYVENRMSLIKKLEAAKDNKRIAVREG